MRIVPRDDVQDPHSRAWAGYICSGYEDNRPWCDEPGAGDEGGVLAIGVDFGVQREHDLVGQLRVELAEDLDQLRVRGTSEARR